MKAIGGKLVEGRVDLPSDMDGVLDTVKTVLKLGGVQFLKMDLESGLTFQRVASDDDNHPFEKARSYVDMSITDIVRQRTMDEFPGGESGFDCLGRAFWTMNMKDFVVTHLVTGPGTLFWSWLKLDPILSARMSSFMGAKMENDKTLGREKLILCGARSKTATPDEVEYSLVIHMEVAQ